MQAGASYRYSSEKSPDDLYFREKQQTICNDIRIYVISLYKFFCEFHSCDWEMVYKFIGEIDLEVQSVINSIIILQLRQEDEASATQDDSSYFYDETSSDYPFGDYTPTELEDIQQNPYLFETPGAYERIVRGQVKNRDTHTMVDALQNRFSSLNISPRAANTLIEGLRNVYEAEANLRRFANFDSLDNL